MQLIAPAKLNLFLHITGRRDDGYHNLETLFQLLDWGDELECEIAEDIQFSQTPPADFPSEENLVVRAAKLLKEATGYSQGARIHLTKRIPVGAGLGGGSSDAASTLLALNHLWSLELSINKLCELGLQLGADVPVFVQGNTSFASGIGEKLQPLELPNRWFLVITPPVKIATAKIFSHPELTRDSTSLFTDEESRLTWGSSASKIRALAAQGGQNDCQAVVEKLYPEVANSRKILEKFVPVKITGTGSSLFLQFDEKSQAENVLAQLKNEGLNMHNAFVAQGVNQSPAHDKITSCRAR